MIPITNYNQADKRAAIAMPIPSSAESEIKIPVMWSIKEVHEKTGLPIHFIRAMIRENKVRYVQAGSKKFFINAQSLADFLNGVGGDQA